MSKAEQDAPPFGIKTNVSYLVIKLGFMRSASSTNYYIDRAPFMPLKLKTQKKPGERAFVSIDY